MLDEDGIFMEAERLCKLVPVTQRNLQEASEMIRAMLHKRGLKGVSNFISLLNQQYQRLIKYPNTSSFIQLESHPASEQVSDHVRQLTQELEQMRQRLA